MFDKFRLSVSFSTLKNLARKLSAFVCVFLVLFSSFMTVYAMSDTYTIVRGRDTYTINCLKLSSEEMVKRAGVELAENDKVEVDEEYNIITVKPEFQFDVVDQAGRRVTLKTNECTVEEALQKAKVNLGKNDTVSPSLGTDLDFYTTQVVVMHWVNVDIVINGTSRTTVQVPSGTKASSALKSIDFSLAAEDICNIDLNQHLSEDTTIDIKQAQSSEQTVIEQIPFETEYVETDSLPKDHKQVQTDGKEGERVIKKMIKVSTTDGSVLQEQELSNAVTKEPEKKVVLVGTANPKTKAKAGKGAPSNYKKVETGVCTAYCDKGTTSTGVRSGVGKVAVDPRDIPYGTKMYICSADGSYVYGYCVAADTGSAIRSGGARVDLFFNSKAECMSFGRRTMNIYFV